MTDHSSIKDDKHALLIEEMSNKKHRHEQCWMYTYRWELLLLIVLAFAAIYYVKTTMSEMFDVGYYGSFMADRTFDYDLGLDKYNHLCDSDVVRMPIIKLR